MYPDQYLYHSGHEWVFAQGEICTIGITEFAQSEMEEIVFVQLPQVGQTFRAGEAIGSVESIKAVAELYTPIGGDVLEINEELLKWPAFFNEDPHGKGWMIKLRLTAPADLDQLMRAEDYERYVRTGD